MFQKFQQINDTIAQYLNSNEPFSLVRIDNSVGYAMHCFSKGLVPSQQFINPTCLGIEGGIVPSTLEYAFSVVYPKTHKIMKECDILGFVDVSGEIAKDKSFLETFESPNKTIFTDFGILDPGAILGLSDLGTLESDPWTKFLKGKRVLVLSSHANTIKHQWKKIDLIWGKNRDIIVPFELVDAISTPYHPAIDDRQYVNCNNFEDLVEITKRRIDSYNYDVLLSGVTNQSPFYVEHVKSKGKVGIQTGGTIQLFFGILGGRWMGGGYSNWKTMFNDNWIHPLDIDKPQKNRDQFKFLESATAYW